MGAGGPPSRSYHTVQLRFGPLNLADAARELRLVVEQDSGDGEAHCSLALVLLNLGKTQEGNRVLQRAKELGACPDKASQ